MTCGSPRRRSTRVTSPARPVWLPLFGHTGGLSHVSADTMWDTRDVAGAPVIFSHSSARALRDSPRNVPDDVLARRSAKAFATAAGR